MRFGGQDGRLSVSIGTWQIDRDSRKLTITAFVALSKTMAISGS